MKSECRAPLIIAIVLLLLPVLYVGSYLALVKPQSTLVLRRKGPMNRSIIYPYRIRSPLVAAFYWPLEQIDRTMRPRAWLVDLPVLDGWKNGVSPKR